MSGAVEVNGVPAVFQTATLGSVGHPRRDELLAATLRSLLDLAGDRSQRPLALTQVRNIARIAEQVIHGDPSLVARVFPVAEKLFKTAGNLQLALTTSRLSLRASERPPAGLARVTDQQLRDRAQTKICGESWVLQRIGELDQADRLALESLQLGQHLGWDRNTAFCLKCRGRLHRMRAEVATDDGLRSRMLDESERLLRDAVEAFSASAEFGPDHPEVGDCQSLLARTLFVARRYDNAWRELLAAKDRLEGERGQNDWADYLILEAEMLAREGDDRGARSRIDEVLREFPRSSDADATEITARALALRARPRANRDTAGATRDYAEAAELYEILEDHTRADEQTWARLVLTRSVPPQLDKALAGEPVGVRVAAVTLFEQELAVSSGRAAGQRRGLSAPRVRQIIANARLEDDRREHRWQ